MNKQHLISTLAGTIIALGLISSVSADQQSWRYDVTSDTIHYGFNGTDNRSAGNREDPAPQQTDRHGWRYDIASDTVIYAGGGNRDSGSAPSADTTRNIAMNHNLPWYYYN